MPPEAIDPLTNAPSDQLAAAAPRSGLVTAATADPHRPTAPVPYHHLLRTPSLRWWKPLVGILALVVMGAVAAVGLGAVGLFLGGGGVPGTPGARLTPVAYLFNNLGLAALIPIAWLVHRLVHGRRPGWLHSVEGRFRWGWLALAAAGVALPTLAWVVLTMNLLPSPSGTNSPLWLWLLLGVLSHPLQAAAEEFAFRGSLQQQVAAWMGSARTALVVSTLVSAVLFTALHGASDPWLSVYYFSMAVFASVLTWRTGGLEASIAFHVLNNVLAFVYAVLTTDMNAAFDRSAGRGSPALLVFVVLAAVMVLVIDRLAARRRIQRYFTPDAASPVTHPA